MDTGIRDIVRNQIPSHLLTDFDEIVKPINYFEEYVKCDKTFLDRLELVRKYGTLEIPTWSVINYVKSVIGEVKLIYPPQLAYWASFLGGIGETVIFTDSIITGRCIYLGKERKGIPVLTWPGFESYISLIGF